MADITITIPTAKIPIVKEAIGYQDKVLDEEGLEIDNPQTAIEYAEIWFISQLRDRVKKHEQRQAVQNATYTDTSDII